MSGKVRADDMPTLLTVAEAAAFLRTPVATLRYWRHLGVGPDGFRLGRRVVYRREDVNRWVMGRQQAQLLRREPDANGQSFGWRRVPARAGDREMLGTICGIRTP